MTERPDTNPAQTLAQDPGARLSDRFGGAPFIWIAGGTLAIFAGVDAMLLPTMMSWREPALVFTDVCSGATSNIAGRFGILLLSVTFLLLAGLRLAAPRSARMGVIFFGIVLGLQFYVASIGGLTAVLEQHPLDKIFGFAVPGCPNGSVQLYEVIQQFYNPGLPGTPGGDVPREFTDMLASNLLLGALAAALLFICGAIRWAMQMKRGRDSAPLPALEAPLAGLLRGPERTVLVQSALVILASLMIGPMLLPYAISPSDASRSVWDLLWVGPFILILDLARLMLVGPRAAETPRADSPDPDDRANTELILDPVASNLQRSFGNAVLERIEIPPVAEHARAQVDAADAIPQPGQGRYLLGTLKSENYVDIMASLNQGVLDRGRTALVICPTGAVGRFAADILDRLEQQNAVLTPTHWLANTQLHAEDGPVDIIFASPEMLGSVLDKIEALKGEIATLGGIFVIGMDRMDVGLLALGLRRLKPFVENPKDMISVVQSEQRGDAADYIAYLPLLNELKNTPRAIQDADRKGPSHLVILREDKEASFEREAHWPNWVQALVQTRGCEPRAEVYIFDTHADHAATLWRDRVVDVMDGVAPADIVAWARDLATPAIFPVDAKHPTALIKDRGNLADALRISIADTNARENLRIVVTGDYPGAGFLHAALSRELLQVKQADRRKTAIDNFCKTYGSYLPKPQGGPVELALLVHQEYRSTVRRAVSEATGAAELRQNDLDRIWAEREEPLEQLGISNTRVGLERLFRQTFRVSNTASFVTRREGEDRRWTYNLADASLANSDMLTTYALEQNLNAPLPGATDPGYYRLLAADHGLSYAEGVRIGAGGGLYEIKSVNEGKQTILVAPDNSQDLRGTTFVREYAIKLNSDKKTQSFAADGRTPIQGTEQPFEIATGYAHVERRTSAVLENGSYRTPLGPGGMIPTRRQTAIAAPLRLRSIGVLRIYRRDGDDGGANKAGRSGAARGLGGGRALGGGRPFGTPAAASAGIDGRLAFTMATTLQDVLRLMFQPLAHRIAVICPDTSVSPPVGQRQWDPATAFCLERQPAIGGGPSDATLANTNRDVTRRHTLPPELRMRYNAFFDAFITQARKRDHVGPATEAPLLTLAVIEDSDHDLGIARFVNDDYQDVLKIWCDFLEHSASEWARRGPHDYAFGSNERPQCYDFQGAYELLTRMR